jgi:hypothetical protein
MDLDEGQLKVRDGIQELDAMKGMVSRWKESYARLVDESGGDEFLCEDFQEEIDQQVFPYLARLFETQHIVESQVREFLEFCTQQITELYNRMQEEA